MCGRSLVRSEEALAREVLECCKQRLAGDFGCTLEDQNADNNIDSKTQVQEDSMGNKDFTHN